MIHLKKHKKVRLRLLLDEGLFKRVRYPRLNQRHDVKHIKHDLDLGGMGDRQIYDLATKEDRIVVVYNTKDFRRHLKADGPTIISLSTSLTDNDADKLLCSSAKELVGKNLKGRLLSISRDGVKFLI